MKIGKHTVKKLKSYLWELAQDKDIGMIVPARIFSNDKMIELLSKDQTLKQLKNVATLPGIVGYAFAMPDAHQGYGFPIGGVAGTIYPTGSISPGGIGYDINCGVRLLRSGLTRKDVKGHLDKLSQELMQVVPCGIKRPGKLTLSREELDQVLKLGAKWAFKNGYATQKDLECIESNGTILEADPACVSDEAQTRGLNQLGTLGSGNHFIEIDVIEEIYDEEVAKNFGLKREGIVVQIHTGSRGLGHQIATDYIRVMKKVMGINHVKINDPQLAYAPYSSKEGKNYFGAMASAANFAFVNRQCISHNVRKVWNKYFNESGGLELVYDVAHNIAKIEDHIVNNKPCKLIVHRKGTTRAFGPGHKDVPKIYRNYGQPVLIPGSMGTASYVLVGSNKSMEESLGSCCHGAGRLMSRQAAKKSFKGKELQAELRGKGTIVKTSNLGELGEEAPDAYKDVDEVIEIVTDAGIAKKVAKLKPLVVIK